MRAIAIVSGKGGVGKTTTAINLGVALNNLGRDIVVVDANVSTPDIGLSLGAPVVPIALQHVLAKEKKAEQAVYIHNSGTKIMPSSLSFHSNTKLENLHEVVKSLKGMADLVLIDCAAGVGSDVMHAIAAADECLIVTNPEMPALSSAMKTIKLSKKLGKDIAGVVVTKMNGGKGVSLKNISSLLEHEILGTIPEDSNVRTALSEKEPLINAYPRSKASRSYNKLARELVGEEDNSSLTKIKDFISDITGL